MKRFCFAIILIGVSLNIANLSAMNTHDLSGLASDIWTLRYDELLEKIKNTQRPWSLKLTTPESFPFEVKWNDEKICFQAGDPGDTFSQGVYYPAFNAPVLASKNARCCFETNYKSLMQAGVEKNILKEIVLEPDSVRVVDNSQLLTFKVKSPEKILKEFYCSSIIDEMEKYNVKKSHLPSLAEVNLALGDSFLLSPDPL